MKQELELDEMGRKLAGALAVKESLERKLEDMNTWHETNKENLGVKEEDRRAMRADARRAEDALAHVQALCKTHGIA